MGFAQPNNKPRGHGSSGEQATNTIIRFATEDFQPEHRFDQWREVRGKSLFGVTIELAPDRRQAFSGSFQARSVAGAVVSEMRASSYRVNRTEADIARIAGDSLCIGLQVKGSGLLHAGRDRIHAVSGGDFTINYSDLPYDAIPGGEADFHYKMLKIPVDDEVMMDHGGSAMMSSDHHNMDTADHDSGVKKPVKPECCNDFCLGMAVLIGHDALGGPVVNSIRSFLDDSKTVGQIPLLHRPPNI